jgi:hypothetical protein
MRAILSNLTAAMLLIHALIGCCRHHEHRCVAGDRAAEGISLTSGCCHCNHSGCHQQSETPPHPDNCNLGCHGVCSYLPPQRTLVDAPQLIVALDILPVDPALVSGYMVPAGACRERINGNPASTLPLRLHLLHQIILV